MTRAILIIFADGSHKIECLRCNQRGEPAKGQLPDIRAGWVGLDSFTHGKDVAASMALIAEEARGFLPC